jgi:hypothetical protein
VNADHRHAEGNKNDQMRKNPVGILKRDVSKIETKRLLTTGLSSLVEIHVRTGSDINEMPCWRLLARDKLNLSPAADTTISCLELCFRLGSPSHRVCAGCKTQYRISRHSNTSRLPRPAPGSPLL